MASKPNMTGAPSGASNVVRIPTAAARKVDNHRFREQRIQARQLKAGEAHRFTHLWPAQRASMRDAETFVALEMTPALMIASAIFETLQPAQQEAAMVHVGKYKGSEKAQREALLTMRLCRPMTIGEGCNFRAALQALTGQRIGLSSDSEQAK